MPNIRGWVNGTNANYVTFTDGEVYIISIMYNIIVQHNYNLAILNP